MSNIARSSIGSQRQRQFNGPLDPDLVFQTKNEMNNYLTRAIRYAGMIVTCLEDEGKLFILNNERDTWLELNGNNGATTEVNAFTGTDITVPVAVGNLKRGDVIPAGTNLQTFLRNFLFKQPVLESRIFPSPSFTFAITNKLPLDSSFLVGDTVTFDLTVSNISRGRILGDVVDELWNNNAIRAENYAGEVIQVKIDGTVVTVEGDGTYKKTITNYTIPSTDTNYSAEVTFADGTSTRITSEGNEIEGSEYSSDTITRTVLLRGGLPPQPQPEPTPPVVTVSNPTFVAPNIRVSRTQSVIDDNNLSVSVSIATEENASRGAIRGARVGDTWVATALQDFRAGAIIGFNHGETEVDAGTGTTWGNSAVRGQTLTLPNVSRTYFVAMQYQQGPQPVNSAGENFDSPLPAGYVTTTFSTTKVTPPEIFYTGTRTSSQLTSITGMTSRTLAGSSFTFTVNAGTPNTQFPAFAVLSTRTVRNVKETSGMILSFKQSSVFSVSGKNYRMYYLDTLAFETLPVNFTFEVNL